MARQLLYNVAVGAVGLAAVALFARKPKIGRLLAVGSFSAVSAIVLAVLIGGELFMTARLAAWATFVHAPLLAVAGAAVAWKHARALRIVLLASAVAIGGVGFYAFRVEPYRLEVTRVRIVSPKVDAPLRVAVLADLQTDVVEEYQRRVLRAVVAAEPDLIVLPGDYIQVEQEELRARLRDALRRMLIEERFDAPHGAIAVGGNVDPPDWPQTFEGTPVRAVTQTTTVRAGPVLVTGLAVEDSFTPGLRAQRSDRFHIVVGHSPDHSLNSSGGDLLIAGHTHGGQVQLPFIGPVVTLSLVPRAWASGVTDLGDGRTLLVTRGAGMERGNAPRLRFLCRPEVVIIDLVPA